MLSRRFIVMLSFVFALLVSPGVLSTASAATTCSTSSGKSTIILNPNTAMPGHLICTISGTIVPLTGSAAKDFRLFSRYVMIATPLGVGSYTVTEGISTITVQVQAIVQTPTAVTCSPVAKLTTASALGAGTVVCPITVTTSNGQPFAGTVSYGSEQYTPYFNVILTATGYQLVFVNRYGATAPAGTYTPQLVAAEPNGAGNLAVFITVVVTAH